MIVESSMFAKDSVLANFCAESEASVISPIRPWMVPTSFEPMDAARPPMAPAIAAPLALMPLPTDSPMAEPPVLPAPPSCLSILAAKPDMVGMIVTDAEPTFTAIYAPPSSIPRILSMSARALSAFARLRSAFALSPGVFGGCGARRPLWPSFVHSLHSSMCR